MESPIPDLIHGLRCLSSNLTKAEAHCESHKITPEALLKARLFPDMFDLTRNVTTACDAAKFTAARLSQTEPPRYEDNEASFSELQVRIAKTIAFLETIADTAFATAETRELAVPLAPEGTAHDGRTYLARYGFPNFYFHLATAYNILRHNGVVLGKRDFLWVS
ncbi:DUF1993 domain-containing protein [Hoeflea sp. WL0058]|uniref:DUF1993 domain-containing protein n=1 Tax=Flavimaribacter sediminis TaxID=2865987 RepID=A0AAE2ZIX1_9HYPH|nr:DUF1993 domain-containing protein [Flavimaribacter sediminis]MBW8635562.1 DUF1993 domain-containing protein [Flavimaribacter sediminis]